VDALDRAGGSATFEEIAREPNIKRPRDVRRRYIPKLEAARVVECSGETVTLAADWIDALNREWETAGEIDAMHRDMRHYERERDAYRNRHKVRPERATEAEMAVGREARHKRRRIGRLVYQGMSRDIATRDVIGADGYIGELELCDSVALGGGP
jgi:hypothetical protein